MSWYLANEHGIIDQFASISGRAELRDATVKQPALADFFTVGATQNVADCISELAATAKQTKNADVKDTAEGLAKLLDGETLVSITQGFADTLARVKESL